MHKTRRIGIILLFFALIAMLITGFYIKESSPANGHKLIGLSMLIGMFILMPTFIYHRWKDKDVKDYMLTKENILKMQEFNNSKDVKK